MGELADILLPTGPAPQGAFYWATVTSTSPLQVRLDGETVPLNIKPMSLVDDLLVGERVWCQLSGKQLLIIKAKNERRLSILRNARNMVSGGGVRKASPSGIAWSQRLIYMGLGKNDLMSNGYFQVEQPPSGTVIPIYGRNSGGGGASSVTVTATEVPLVNWQTLYYDASAIGAPGGASNYASDPSKFRIAYYGYDSFEVPPTWIPIVMRNGDTASYFWADGQESCQWTYPALNSPWTAYGSGYMTPRYKRENGMVIIEGLVRGSTTGAAITGTIFVLPVGYRPDNGNRICVTHASGGITDLRIYTSGTVSVSGYLAGGNANDVSLEVPPFPADQ